MKNKCLVLVDFQNDFVEGGALEVPGGRKAANYAATQCSSYELVIATQDWHPKGHVSFASSHSGKKVGDEIEVNSISQMLWPDHCVQETLGAEITDDFKGTSIHEFVKKGVNPGVDSYSGFFDNQRISQTNLEEILRSRKINGIDVMGLATNFCVMFTVLDALSLGFKVNLLTKGCAGIELHPNAVSESLEKMRCSGATIV